MIRYNVSQGISLYYLPDELHEDHTHRTTRWFPVTRRVYYTARYIFRRGWSTRLDQKRAGIGLLVEFSVRRRHFVRGFVFRLVTFSQKHFRLSTARFSLKPDIRPFNCFSHEVSKCSPYLGENG